MITIEKIIEEVELQMYRELHRWIDKKAEDFGWEECWWWSTDSEFEFKRWEDQHRTNNIALKKAKKWVKAELKRVSK